MDLQSAQAELATLQLVNSNLVENVKSTGRNLTAAEITKLEADSDRIIELKAAIRGLKNGVHMQDNGTRIETEYPNGLGNGDGIDRAATGAKGFLSASGIKSAVRKTTQPGLKAVLAGGSSFTPVSLDQRIIPMGSADSLGLLSVIPVTVRDNPTYSYLRQTVRTNAAAKVAAGGTKPTSVFTAESVPNTLEVYAHLSEYIDRFLLEDADELESWLESELRNGVLRKVTAGAIASFIAAPGIQTVATASGFTAVKAIDGVYAGLRKVGTLGFNPDLVILSSTDYDTIRLAKNGDGDYFSGSPFATPNNDGIWGVTVLDSPDIAQGTALTLDSSKVGISTDRQGIRTDWDAISGFATNQLRARTEGRFAVDVKVPAAVAKVTFTA